MLKRLKELASDSLTYGLSTMLSQLLSLILVPFYTRELRPEDYGILAMSALLLGFFSPVAGLGMDGALFRYYSMTDDPERKNAYFSLATQIKTVAMVLACLLLLPFYGWLNGAFFEGLLTPLQFGLFLGSFVADNFSALTIVTLRSERKVRKIATINVLTLLVSLLLSVWLVLFEKMHVTGALLAGLLSSLFRAMMYWADSRRLFRWSGLERTLVNDLLGYGLPVVPHKIQAQVIQVFTAFMINQKLGIAASGLYAVATKLAKPLSFVVSIVQQSWVPFKFHIHKTDAHPAQTFRQLIGLYWLGIILLWGILSLLTPWLYHWLIDPKYWDGIPYVPFIMAISVAQAFYFTVTTGFELSSRQSLMAWASFTSMVVMVGLSLATIDIYPPYPFIISQALAFLILAGIIYTEAKTIILIDYPYVQTVALAGVTFMTVFWLFEQMSVLSLLGGFGIMLIASLLTLAGFVQKGSEGKMR